MFSVSFRGLFLWIFKCFGDQFDNCFYLVWKDLTPYTCAGCGVKQGRRSFDTKDIENKTNADKRKIQYILFCPSCKKREQDLLALMGSNHARECTCGNRRVQRKRMVSCRVYPDRTRGCNLGVRGDDVNFLLKRPSNLQFIYRVKRWS